MRKIPLKYVARKSAKGYKSWILYMPKQVVKFLELQDQGYLVAELIEENGKKYVKLYPL